jgi:hypothetical protein
MKFTLKNIIDDLTNIIRGHRVTQSERLSPRQIEAWINQYRALLVKQEFDKGKKPNPDYIQTLSNVELVPHELETEEIETDYFVYRSKFKLPKSIDLNHKSGILYISDLWGNEIQLMIEPRVNWQKHRRFTGNNRIAYLKDGYLYAHNHELLEYVTIRGVFEIPLEAVNYEAFNNGERLIALDFEYPIPANKITTLRQMILERELGLSISTHSDNKNDGVNILSGNVAGGQAAE